MIALLKPTLQAEFGWSDRDYGHMASAFQFAAALALLGVGWAIDRLGLKRGFTAPNRTAMMGPIGQGRLFPSRR